jgi:hypothetical protein
MRFLLFASPISLVLASPNSIYSFILFHSFISLAWEDGLTSVEFDIASSVANAACI